MRKKVTLFGALIIVMLMAGILYSYQMSRPDMPAGYLPERWIPLSDKSGILLTVIPKGLDPQFVLHGTLWIKADNTWHRFSFDPGPAQTIPARY